MPGPGYMRLPGSRQLLQPPISTQPLHTTNASTLKGTTNRPERIAPLNTQSLLSPNSSTRRRPPPPARQQRCNGGSSSRGIRESSGTTRSAVSFLTDAIRTLLHFKQKLTKSSSAAFQDTISLAISFIQSLVPLHLPKASSQRHSGRPGT